jgi:hypothetical protein
MCIFWLRGRDLFKTLRLALGHEQIIGVSIKLGSAPYRPLAGLNNQCHALAHTYTHGAERIAATAAFEFISSC